MSPQHRSLLSSVAKNGVIVALLGMLLFTLNDVMGKWLVSTYSVGQVVMLRSAAALIVLAPLLGSIIAGLFGRLVGRAGAHTATILGVAVSCALSCWVLYQLVVQGASPFNENLYTFFEVGNYTGHVGFMIDKLTAMMMVVVTFVSLLVHLYTIGYMAEDPGYQRFFSYISLFTFSMLMLVMSNNFLQLFFGWEAVGLVSYLLIGFWFKRPTAIFANMKAFLVNRVGDFGFLLGIAGVLATFYNAFISPDMLHWTLSGSALVMAVIGGTSVVWGPALGAVVFFFIKEIAGDATEHWPAVIGIILIVVTVFVPSGLSGLILRMTGRRV